jgi:hypothetical protein
VADPPPTPPTRGFKARVNEAVSTTGTAQRLILALGATATAIAAVWQLAEQITGDDTPVGTRSGKITKLDTDERDKLNRSYCEEDLIGEAREACLSGIKRERLGNVYEVKLKITGRDNSCCYLGWAVKSPTAGTVAANREAITGITPEGDDEFGFLLWIPNPNIGGDYTVTFTLYGENDTLLDSKRSEFTVAGESR